MKVRLGFVTNSSSSSFLIAKRHLSEKQVEAIHKHSKLGEKLEIDYSEEAWSISESENYISGYTSMDNFCMDIFFKLIGVPGEVVIWNEWNDAYECEHKENKKSWKDYLDEI